MSSLTIFQRMTTNRWNKVGPGTKFHQPTSSQPQHPDYQATDDEGSFTCVAIPEKEVTKVPLNTASFLQRSAVWLVARAQGSQYQQRNPPCRGLECNGKADALFRFSPLQDKWIFYHGIFLAWYLDLVNKAGVPGTQVPRTYHYCGTTWDAY
ncbi:hypothetical protein BDW02DRAFT_410144 [Decorospora gaudefroyi]|uniref:Uncharacterized protein n=1 Tax=Decorospora gaudefroyi TaxID=184978 RepID=A0A6A5K9X2_9PLEO|nr:hypothetical protein BDW02DRAFT_410144 [Decorospora gaudefroyi]